MKPGFKSPHVASDEWAVPAGLFPWRDQKNNWGMKEYQVKSVQLESEIWEREGELSCYSFHENLDL